MYVLQLIKAFTYAFLFNIIILEDYDSKILIIPFLNAFYMPSPS
jgi:hypothetical protein